MGIINTKKWLIDYGDQPVKLCENLKVYFKDYSSKEIYDYLTLFGMYKPSIFHRAQDYEPFINTDYWSIIRKQYTNLKKKWEGPDVSIFIFPVNQRQKEIMREYNGKSGLAFSDKLFLFLAPEVDKNEIRALLTHEYHHVCRLNHMNKKEKDITLLDSIILEGLAEHSVRSHCGMEYNANWTKYYSNEQLKKWWKEIVYPNRDVQKHEHSYQEILYGLKGKPKMLGYCVGYYLVDLCLNSEKFTLKTLEKLPSKKIVEIATDN
jgi:uncharacterized protein YjaZ